MNPEEQALLEQLHDVVAPAPPGWWPLAVGWWVVLLLVLVAIVALFMLIRNLKKRRQQNLWRKDALAAHQSIAKKIAMTNDGNVDQSAELAQLSVLMRRVALALLPRQQVAALTDDSWLMALDDLGNTQEYTQGIGQSLSRAPYRRSQYMDKKELSSLLKLTKATINTSQPNVQIAKLERSVAAI